MSLSTFITERIKVTSKTKPLDRPSPTSKDELRQFIEQELERQGPDADLNHIDVSGIDNMSFLFNKLNIRNIKIDEWNTGNVTNMSYMFMDCRNFNCDLSGWDVSNVTNMSSLFRGCKKFNCDLSKWDVSNVTNMNYIFNGCQVLKTDLSGWDVDNVRGYEQVFSVRTIMPEEFKPKFISLRQLNYNKMFAPLPASNKQNNP